MLTKVTPPHMFFFSLDTQCTYEGSLPTHRNIMGKKHKKRHEKIHPSSSTSTDSTQTLILPFKKRKKKEKKNKKDVLLDATVYTGIQTIDLLPVCLFLRQCKNSLVPEFLATMLQRGCPTYQ